LKNTNSNCGHLNENLKNSSKFSKHNKKYNSKKDSYLKIFIMTHKDFKNYRFNPVYTIVADDISQLKKNYSLNVIYAKEGKLFNMKRGYGEMSKLYYIYQLYKNGTFSSKYIGLNHYRRFFNFTDNIPDLDKIFENYDVILNEPFIMKKGMKNQFCHEHICKNFDELLDIIKDIKPDYYETAIETIKEKRVYVCNLFIMKTKDFLKYCNFIYDVLFEFDRRKNFTSDDDVLKYVKKYYKKRSLQLLQSRLQGFLAERLNNIFFHKNFKSIKSFESGNYKKLNKNFKKSRRNKKKT